MRKEKRFANLEERLKESLLSREELSCIENVINFLEHIEKWKNAVDEAIRGKNEDLVRKLERLKKDMKVLKKWILLPRSRFSDQELKESALEITRFDLLCAFYKIEFRMKNHTDPNLTEEIIQRFNACLEQLTNGTPLTKEKETQAKQSQQEVKQCLTGLAISESERIEIVEAMATEFGRRGHWFKCKNGERRYSVDGIGSNAKTVRKANRSETLVQM